MKTLIKLVYFGQDQVGNDLHFELYQRTNPKSNQTTYYISGSACRKVYLNNHKYVEDNAKYQNYFDVNNTDIDRVINLFDAKDGDLIQQYVYGDNYQRMLPYTI